MNKTKGNGAMSTNTLVMYALLTAIVIVLQLMGQFIRLGTFSVSLVLAPIVIGAALCGPVAGAWLGFVFSVAVLFTDSAPFLAISVPGTIITVIAKGTLAGLVAGLVYKSLENKGKSIAVISAGIVCPIVNTGVFIIGCRLFFFDTLAEWAQGFGFGDAVWQYIILVLVGGNFIFELVINLILSSVIVRLINMRVK